MSGGLHGTIHLDQAKWFNTVSVLNTEWVSNAGSERNGRRKAPRSREREGVIEQFCRKQAKGKMFPFSLAGFFVQTALGCASL